MSERLDKAHMGKQISILLFGRCIAFALMFFLPLLLARLFPQSLFGLYRQFFLVFYAAYVLMQLGINVSLPTLVVRLPEQRESLLTTAMCLLAGVGVLSCLLGGLVQFFFAGTHPLLSMGLVLGLFTGLMLAASPLEPMLLAEHRAGEAAAWIVAWDLLRGGLLLGAAWLSDDLGTALWWMTLAAALRWLAMIVLFRLRYRVGWSLVSLSLFRQQMREAGPLSLQAMAHLLEINIDRYVMMACFSATVFAVYTVGAFQLPLVDMLFSSVCGILLPLLAQHHSEGETEALCSLYRDTVRRMLMVLMPLALCLFVARREMILLLFSSRYEQSIPVFSIYLFIVPTYATLSALLLQAIGHGRYLALSSIGKAFGAALFILCGLSFGGMLGVVVALVSYHYTAAFALLWLSAKGLGVPFRALFPSREAVSLLVICGLAFAAQACVPVVWEKQFLLVGLIARPLCCMAVFFPLLFASQVLSDEDRIWISRQKHKLFGRFMPLKEQHGTSP